MNASSMYFLLGVSVMALIQGMGHLYTHFLTSSVKSQIIFAVMGYTQPQHKYQAVVVLYFTCNIV